MVYILYFGAMTIKGKWLLFGCAALAALLTVFTPCAMAEDASRSLARSRAEAAQEGDLSLPPLENKIKRKLPGYIFHRRSKVPAATQLATAAALEDANERSAACAAYDRLVRSFPFSPAASVAQLRLARLLEKDGKYKRAYEEYIYMLEFYPENAPADSILRQMYAIANYYRTNGKESRALDYFKRLAEVAPRWKHTPDVLMQVGNVQFAKRDLYDAAESFETVSSTVPGSPLALEALASQALVLYALSVKYPRDDAIQQRAIALTSAALRDCPASLPSRAELSANLKDLNLRREERFYDMAVFYDRGKYTDETRLAAYRDFLRRFPASSFAGDARRRIEELSSNSKDNRK